jgi:hypothetical protein
MRSERMLDGSRTLFNICLISLTLDAIKRNVIA